MSASLPVNMRGPQVKTPLLLLLLLATLTATDQLPSVSYATLVPHPYSEEQTVEEITEEDPGSGQGRFYPGNDVPETTADPSFMGPNTTSKVDEEDLSIIIILIPVVLVVVIIALIVCGVFITCRWNKKTRDEELKKEDPYLDGSSTEKVPMPMFEEDVPSVLEVEMDELDQWMKKDG